MTTEKIYNFAERTVHGAPGDSRHRAVFVAVIGWNVATLGGAGTYNLVTVNAGDIVLAVQNLVTSAPTGGGTPGVAVGDGGDTGRFIADGTVSISAAVADVPYRYSGADTIDLTVAAGTTAGAGSLYVTIFRP